MMPIALPSPVSLSDDALTHALRSLASRERSITVEFVRHIAEFDGRRLWAPAGFPSMHEYCVRELHLSDAAAYKRIRAARLSRRFPQVFEMLEDGRLHLSAIVVLNKYLVETNVDELLALAAHKTRDEVELLVAERFPRADTPTRIRPLPSGPTDVAPGETLHLLSPGTVNVKPPTCPIAPAACKPVNLPRAAQPDLGCSARAVVPLAPQRFALQVTISDATRDKLRRAQELLGFAIGPNDVAEVLDRALEALIEKHEKRKYARTDRPKPPSESKNPRHIPAHVRRAVWARDRGRCTYVSDGGHRCDARSGLELDHIVPVARGGESTADNLRVRCRPHNQLEAERAFGAAFMDAKRERAGANARGAYP